MGLIRQGLGAEAPLEYEGCVLETREENGYHDSDFYAIVWDAEAKAVRRVEYGTTRGAGHGYAKVDATDEVKALVYAWNVEKRYEHAKAVDERAAKTVARGKRVAITRDYRSRKLGRTLAKGETGTVFWYGRGYGETYAEKYGRKPPMRAGVEFGEGEKLFLSEDDLEVAGWEEHLADDAELQRRAEQGAGGSLAWYFTTMSVVF